MKKIISLTMAVLMLAAMLPVSAAFTDIASQSESIAAESLATIGIFGGVGGTSFAPNGTLTRGQFAKIATVGMGFDEESRFKNYTIFPDVPSTAWEAPYVNAAVREYELVNGYPDGTFGPNDPITVAQAATILLRMLGYTDENVGMFWPNDHMAKAEDIGLFDGMATTDPYANISRGQAAILFKNALLTDTTVDKMLISVAFTTSTDDSAVLLATGQTDTTLDYNEVRVYDGSEIVEMTCESSIASSLVGMKGVLVYTNENQTELEGFVAASDGRRVQIKSRDAAEITLSTGETLKVPSATQLSIGGDITTYGEGWFDLRAGSQVIIYEDEDGAITLIASLAATAGGEGLVYGVDNINLNSGWTVIKDGITVDKNAVEKYDVVVTSATDATYYVSSEQITVLYESAGPTYSNPSWITAGGVTYQIADAVSSDFAQLDFNDTITLLFDHNGAVAAAFPSKTVRANAVAILDTLTEDSASVTTLFGRELSGQPSFSGFSKSTDSKPSSLYEHVGRLVKVYQNNDGQLVFDEVEMDPIDENINFHSQTVDGDSFSDDIRIFEQISDESPLVEVALSDLQDISGAKSQALHAMYNDAGDINLLIIEPIIGEGYEYTFIRQEMELVEQTVTWDGTEDTYTKRVYTTFVMTDEGEVEYANAPHLADIDDEYVAVAVAKTAIANKNITNGAVMVLVETDTVSQDAFLSSTSMVLDGGTATVSDNVSVYDETREIFISLSEARANFDEFTVYCDRDVKDGGVVRILTVK